MEYMEKSALLQSKKKRKIVKITVVAVICAAGILLAAYSILVKSYLYAALYIIAVILGLAYVVIKVNSDIPCYLAATRDTVCMQCWDNGAFPYRINFKPAFIADFIPARVQRQEIPIADIKSVMVGSRNFLARNLEGTSFPKRMDEIAKSRRTEKGAVRKMDFICILDKRDRVYFMPVTDMEPDALARVVNLIHRKNADAEIKCNLREIRNRLTVR